MRAANATARKSHQSDEPLWTMATRSKIAAVSYLNTVPLIYGIEHAGLLRADLLLAPPADCARAFERGEADIALVPAGALPRLGDTAEIITSYCIGAVGSVRTVTVMSNRPVTEAAVLRLDSHSMTSVRLAQVLCRELWKISPRMEELSDYSVLEHPADDEAYLLIGDKVFPQEGRFRHVRDLADCWRELTGLPFVFAVWVARPGTDPEAVDALERSLTFGVERIWEAVNEYGHAGKPYAYDYLTRNIDFLLDAPKRRALELFLDKSGRAVRPPQPG